MASTTENAPKDATEDPKLDVFEDDDEFEEFENEGGCFLHFLISHVYEGRKTYVKNTTSHWGSFVYICS